MHIKRNTETRRKPMKLFRTLSVLLMMMQILLSSLQPAAVFAMNGATEGITSEVSVEETDERISSKSSESTGVAVEQNKEESLNVHTSEESISETAISQKDTSAVGDASGLASHTGNERAATEASARQVTVASFDELKAAVAAAVPGEKTEIHLTASIEVTETITIPAGKDIVISAHPVSGEGVSTTSPIGVGDAGVISLPEETDMMATRKQLMEEATSKGAAAISTTNTDQHPVVIPAIVMKRGSQFKGTFFTVASGATFTLGTDVYDPLFLDGNTDVQTNLTGIFVTVSGHFVFNGGTLAFANNEKAYSAPVYLNKRATMTMEGGRITSNVNHSYAKSPDGTWSGDYYSVGGIYVSDGASLEMNGGSIDNNTAAVGGVFVGAFGASAPTDVVETFATFIMNGGWIVNNNMIETVGQSYTENYGGGVHVDAHAKVVMNNGIIAGNESFHGGGVAVTDGYVQDFDGVSYSKTYATDYDTFIQYAGAYFTMNGGLIYKNTAKTHINPNASGAGGGLYINSSTVSLKNGYFLENHAENQGGAVYVSIVPHSLKLEHTIVTQNKAVSGAFYQYASGEGGGYWNCPVGIVDFEDFHSLYIFGNEAESSIGNDIRTIRKRSTYQLNSSNVASTFYTSISPLSQKEHLASYVTSTGEVANIGRTNATIELTAKYSDALVEEAWENSTLFILSNTALKGAGIGSNAHLYAPGKEGTYAIPVEKSWSSEFSSADIPSVIRVDLYIGDTKYSDIELTKANEWKGTFSNLPYTKEELESKGLAYSVREQTVPNSIPDVQQETTGMTLKRVWLNENNQYAQWDQSNPYMDNYIKINHVNAKGELIYTSEVNMKGSGASPWETVITSKWFEGKTVADIDVVYHSMDQRTYGNVGVDNYATDAESAHVIVVHEPVDGRITVEIPYLWVQGLDTQGWPNNVGVSSDYARNNIGYKVTDVALLPHPITHLINYKENELTVVKRWDAIQEKDRPTSIRFTLYVEQDNGEIVEFKDQQGNNRTITLSKETDWKGTFEHLPSNIQIPNSRYHIVEETDQFIASKSEETVSLLNLDIKRVGTTAFPIYKDYTGGMSRIKEIPVVVEVDGKRFPSSMTYKKETFSVSASLSSIPVEGLTEQSTIRVEEYVSQDGTPFSRNLGTYKERTTGFTYVDKVVEGEYVFKLEKEGDNQFVLKMPKLTPADSTDQLLEVAMTRTNVSIISLVNHYKPVHKITVSKKWNADRDVIPSELPTTITYGTWVQPAILSEGSNWTVTYNQPYVHEQELTVAETEFEAFFKESEQYTTRLTFVNELQENVDIVYEGHPITGEQAWNNIKQEPVEFVASSTVTQVELTKNETGWIVTYPFLVKPVLETTILLENTQRTSIELEKRWDDEDNREGIRPESVQLTLFVNGQVHSVHELTAEMGWKKVMTDLPVYQNGEKLNYSIQETEVEGYSSEVKDFVVINHRTTTPPPPPPVTPIIPIVPDQPEEPQTPPLPNTGAVQEVGWLGVLCAMGGIGLLRYKKRSR